MLIAAAGPQAAVCQNQKLGTPQTNNLTKEHL